MSLGRTLSISRFRSLRYQILRQCRRTAFTPESDDRDLDVPRGTHLNFLNDPDEKFSHLYINRYSRTGFTLSTGVHLKGPIVFFPRSFLSWKVKNIDDVNQESLSLFNIIHPKLDILLIGTGSEKATVSKEVIKYLRENNINFEILTTEKAIPTFNFLCAEQRWVAAALIPPSNIQDSLSLEIKKHLEAVDFRARLESEEEEDKKLIGDNKEFEKGFEVYLNKAKYWKGPDEKSLTTAKAAGSPERDVQAEKQPTDNPLSSSGIKYVSRSDYSEGPEVDPKTYVKEYMSELAVKDQDFKEIRVARSPLDVNWQGDTDVGTTVSRQKTDIVKESDKDNKETSDKGNNPSTTK